MAKNRTFNFMDDINFGDGNILGINNEPKVEVKPENDTETVKGTELEMVEQAQSNETSQTPVEEKSQIADDELFGNEYDHQLGQISLRLPVSQLRKIEYISEKYKITKTSVITKILGAYFEQFEK